MSTFVGTGIYIPDSSGGVSVYADGYPWRNSLRLKRWINPPGWAGQCGLYHDVIDGDTIVFTLILTSKNVSLTQDAYLGPYVFQDCG